ncbi:MAG: tRNA-uridine aminocarboxypropyltransferase [Burkholderiaceae bacterium]
MGARLALGLAGRRRCAVCSLPSAACLCRFVQRADNPCQVLILQHPLEARESKGSTRLLNLCLARCRVAVGEVFDPAALDAWLHFDGRRSVLLYPGDTPGPIGELARPADIGRTVQLVVLDGTWRKSLKMLMSNPLLQALPRLSLQPADPSRYGALRKARRASQLSTLEATCEALALLDGNPTRYAPVLQAFERFVADRMARAPSRPEPGASPE